MATTALDSQSSVSISVLNNLTNDQMTQYSQIAIEFILGTATHNTTESKTKLATFIADNNLKRSYETAFYNLVNIIIGHVQHNNPTDLLDTSLQATSLQEEYIKIVLQFYQRNSNTIQGVLSENVFKLSTLLNIEWRFGVTTSSSSLSQIGTCFLQLKLATMKNGIPDTTIVEMTLPQFYSFLAVLQKSAAEVGHA